MSKRRNLFTMDEVSTMFILVAELDPNTYAAPETKALIYRCKGIAAALAAGRRQTVNLVE